MGLKPRVVSRESELVASQFRGASSATRAILERIRELGKATGKHTTSPEASKGMLAAVDALVDSGASRMAALHFCLAQPHKPLLGNFLRDERLTAEDRVEILAHFVKKADKEHYPMLDLSRQNLRFVPKEITEVSVSRVKVGGTIPYCEINLGYNPLRKLGAKDYQRLNAFEGIHLMATQLRELTSEVELVDNAIMLNLSWNELTTLPKEVYRLERLRALKLNWTNVVVSKDVGKLVNLALIELCETPTLSSIYQLRDKKRGALTAAQKEAKQVQKILHRLRCRIGE